jgi:hypothetical protein
VFCFVGTVSLSSSILCSDLVRYYQNKYLLTKAQESVRQLKSLDAEYGILIKTLEDDPNLIVERLGPATFGPDPNLYDSNTVYPRATAEQLAAARRALMAEPNESTPSRAPAQIMPQWLSRCSEPRRKTMLFICGVVLILTSFVCFRPAKPTAG